MIISEKALVTLTIAAGGILTACYASRHMWSWVFLIIAVGVLWLYGQKRGWRWVGPLGMTFYIITAARGIFLDISAGWFLLGTVITLCAWDLDSYLNRLRRAGRVEKMDYLEQHHLYRLMIVSGLGLLLGGIPLVVRMEMKFGWILFWVMVLVIGLSRLIEMLNRESD